MLDSTEVPVEQDVTALVGMNESGKSAMLDALYKLNPVYGDRFVERDDYPRWRWKRDGRSEDLSQVSPVEATFQLEASDLEALRAALGDGVSAPETVTLGRQYDDHVWVRVAVDIKRFLAGVVDGHPDADALLAAHDSVASLREALAARPAATPADGDAGPDEDEVEDVRGADAEALARITALVGDEDDLEAIAEDVVRARLPKF